MTREQQELAEVRQADAKHAEEKRRAEVKRKEAALSTWGMMMDSECDGIGHACRCCFVAKGQTPFFLFNSDWDFGTIRT